MDRGAWRATVYGVTKSWNDGVTNTHFFFCCVRTQQEARKRGLTRHQTSQHLDLGLPSLQNHEM